MGVTSTHTPESDTQDAVVSAQAERPPRQRTRARHRRWVLVSVLVLLLGGAVAGDAYLWQVSEAWIERDAQWQVQARSLTASLGETTTELEDTMAELEVVRGQLDQAQTRISELADEKAQLGDEHAVVRQLAEYQERVQTAATAVVAALDSCIASQQRLIRWYRDTEEPTDEDLLVLAELGESVNTVCSAAQEAKDALAEELDG